MLRHENARVVYGIALATNFSDVLLGRSAKPLFLLPQSNPRKRSELIADYWRRRWLSKQIKNEKILADIEAHELTYPVTHGARVPLSRGFQEAEEDVLFEAWGSKIQLPWIPDWQRIAERNRAESSQSKCALRPAPPCREKSSEVVAGLLSAGMGMFAQTPEADF